MLAARFRAADARAAREGACAANSSRSSNSRISHQHFPNTDECAIMLAYCGDVHGWGETRDIASGPGRTTSQIRREREEIRLRPSRPCLFRDGEDSVRRLLEKILAETETSSSVEFRGDVLDVMSRIDDPALAAVVLAAAELAGRAQAAGDRAVDRARDLDEGITRGDRGQAGPRCDRQPEPAQAARKNSGPGIARRLKAIWGTIRDGRNPRRERLVDEMRQLVRNAAGRRIQGAGCL